MNTEVVDNTEECTTCGKTHPYVGECRGDDMDKFPSFGTSSQVMADKHATYAQESSAEPLREITNEYGYLQYVDEEDNATCPGCNCLVVKNRGQGTTCEKCNHEALVEMSHDHDEAHMETCDWADSDLREELDEETFHGMCEEASEQHDINECVTCHEPTDTVLPHICKPCKEIEDQNDKLMEDLHKRLEAEALRRFFAGEEPTFSTGTCEFLTAGYGEISEFGYWEYPLPAPCEQWYKKKDFDFKTKINGMKYKVRVVPFGSEEIIKRNFVHYLYWDHVDNHKKKESFDYIVDRLKNRGTAFNFLPTRSVGDFVLEHGSRMYLEVVDETYPAAGLTHDEFCNTPIHHH